MRMSWFSSCRGDKRSLAAVRPRWISWSRSSEDKRRELARHSWPLQNRIAHYLKVLMPKQAWRI